MKKLCDDVNKFLEESSDIIGTYESECFHSSLFCHFAECEITSPIEQLFECAFRVLAKLNGLKKIEPETINGENYLVGIGLLPQHQVGKYRVDFLATYGRFHGQTGEHIEREVVVECDSQEFHERTESERRYEKERDRFLQLKNYKVFHFTGKEIKDNPFWVASEVMAYLLDDKRENVWDGNYIPEKYQK